MKNFINRRRFRLAAVLFVLAVCLAIFAARHQPAQMQVAETAQKPEAAAAPIHAAGRGNPHFNFADGKDLVAAQANNQNSSPAQVSVSADFDSDGVPDSVTADAGGIV